MTLRCGCPSSFRIIHSALLGVVLLSGPPLLARSPHCEEIIKSVVKISAQGRALTMGPKGVSYDKTESLGSGVLLDDQRHVLTAAHVLGLASSIQVGGPTRATSAAHPIMVDRDVDIAILEMEEDLPGTQPVRFASHAPRPGDELWTLGHPLNLDYSLSRGIVSAVRNLSDTGIYGWNGHLIQTDAAMNPGVSGGGLFDKEGRLVGIAVSILSVSGGSEGIGFGVDLEAIQDVLTASPCIWLGVDAVTVSKTIGEALGLPRGDAYLVQQIFPGGAADKAGLHPGEFPAVIGDTPLLLGGSVITKIDGYEECRKACRRLSDRGGASQELTLEVWRQGKSETVKIPMGGKHVNWASLFGPVRAPNG